MSSKIALARRLVADFHGEEAADRAEAEWRRIHQGGQLPTGIRRQVLPARVFKAYELLVSTGEVQSNGDAVRLIRQRAVRVNDSLVDDPVQEFKLALGDTFTISIGRKRFVRVEAGGDATDA
jgi:tyrosyl-tRNA synthetase